jgi:hypothetical protein
MKNVVKLAGLVFGIAAATLANAQNSSDPSYSIHNYKHPNKAAKMKAIEDAKPEAYLVEDKKDAPKEENAMTASGNYKGMSPGKSKLRKFFVSSSSSDRGYASSNAPGNYKQQFPARTRKTSAPEHKENSDAVVRDTTRVR